MYPPLAPDYLNAISTQLASVSAFFGGFAATVFALFLTLGRSSRAASIAAQASAIAAICFIVAVMASTVLVAISHPHAPPPTARLSADPARLIQTVSFLAGMVALMVSLGAGGWTHSRAMGWTTSVLGTLAVVAIAYLYA
jgi:hypothetical protein